MTEVMRAWLVALALKYKSTYYFWYARRMSRKFAVTIGMVKYWLKISSLRRKRLTQLYLEWARLAQRSAMPALASSVSRALANPVALTGSGR